MDKDTLLATASANGYSVADGELLAKAVEFAARLLSSKKRLIGDTFFDHNLRVALLLIENKADPEVVAAGVLHGVIRDVPLPELEKTFGKEVVSLLQEVDSLKELKIRNDKVGAESLRKILLTTVRDVRVIVIKLVNKIDNLQTLGVFPPAEQKRIATEVLDV